MNDRELLAFAAKAVKLNYDPYVGKIFKTSQDGYPMKLDWNPLTDLSDTLKLAIDLELTIDVHSTGVVVFNRSGIIAKERLHPNPYDAVCRAVVNCAAKIAKFNESDSCDD